MPDRADDDSTLTIQQLIDAHHQAVYRYAYRLCGSVTDAEDLAQQTFLIAHQKIGQIREASKADRWLFAVLRSCFLKNRRRRVPTSVGNLDLDIDLVPMTEYQVDHRLDQELMDRALAELPDASRLVLVMYYFEQCSYKEIARKLNVPIGTVMSRLARAKAHLRARLATEGAEGIYHTEH